MKKLAILAAAAICACSCFHIRIGERTIVRAEGPEITKTYDLSGFSAIRAEGTYEVKFVQADNYFVQVRAAQNIHDILDFKVDDGVLILKMKDKKIGVSDLDVTIKSPDLKKVEIKGAADMEISSVKVNHDLDISIDGAGDLEAKHLRCHDMAIVINGAGDMDLEGLEAKAMKIDINGAGDIELEGQAEDVDVTINGTGSVIATALAVSGNFNKRINGIGSVKR